MADAFNPYAPPAADLDLHGQVGSVARDGKLVRMDAGGHLPGRCLACNAPALPARVARTLYWTPLRWRLFAWGLPLALFALMSVGVEYALYLFWPVVLIVTVANMAIRKRVQLELGICERHQNRRRIIHGGAWFFILVVVALTVFALINGDAFVATWLFLLIPLMLIAGLASSVGPVMSVRLANVSGKHLWLKNTGQPFRDSLPEAAPD